MCPSLQTMTRDVHMFFSPYARFFRSLIAFVVLCGGLCVGVGEVRACYSMVGMFASRVHQLTPEERRSIYLYKIGKYTEARTTAEKMLAKDPQGYVAHFVMACVHRHAEGELMKALWYVKRSWKSISKRLGPKMPSFTHRMFLHEWISLLRQLGRDKKAMKLIAYHDKMHPKHKLEDLLPWILMKLRRYKAANKLAKRYLKQKKYMSSALNALCAISYEEGHRAQSLKFCKKAVQFDLRKSSTYERTIHMTNLAEAYLSVFQFEPAEQYALSGTRFFHRSMHGNPWEMLVTMYLDQGRFNDAWNALKRARLWFLRQAPKLSESLFASNQMNQANFFVTIGQAKLALKALSRIKDRPDRHGHTSAKVEQQVAGARLVRRRARLLSLEQMRERAATYSFFGRMGRWFRERWMSIAIWRESSQIRRTLAKGTFLYDTLSPYRSGGMTIPYRMTHDLIALMGPAIIRKVLSEIRQKESGAPATMGAMLRVLDAEAALKQGKSKEALRLSRRALLALPKQLRPLRLRMFMLQGQVYLEQGDHEKMRRAYARVLHQDGSFFRLLRLSLPVKISTSGDRADFLKRQLLRSPRFSSLAQGFSLRLHAKGKLVQVVLTGGGGNVLSRVQVLQKAKEKDKAFWLRVNTEIHQQLFTPHVEISRQEIFSLDNSLLRTPTHRVQWQKLFRKVKPKR
ncbi:MAG: hypothetical protein CL920_17350 [Deltaproteobacteria bacterium]|nr:hypothetical protein [Deltaproteobacteria bacterium]